MAATTWILLCASLGVMLQSIVGRRENFVRHVQGGGGDCKTRKIVGLNSSASEMTGVFVSSAKVRNARRQFCDRNAKRTNLLLLWTFFLLFFFFFS